MLPIHLIVTSPQALPATLTTEAGSDPAAPTNTLTVDAYDEDGFTIPSTGVEIADQLVAAYAQRTAKKRRLAVTITPGTTDTIDSVVLTIPAFETPDNRVGDADDMSKEVKFTI